MEHTASRYQKRRLQDKLKLDLLQKRVYVHLAILPCPKWQGTACKPWVYTSQVSRSSRCDSGRDNSRCCEVKADWFRFEKYQDRIEDLRSLFWSTQTSEPLMGSSGEARHTRWHATQTGTMARSDHGSGSTTAHNWKNMQDNGRWKRNSLTEVS